jgi:hypothetical protein
MIHTTSTKPLKTLDASNRFKQTIALVSTLDETIAIQGTD